MDSMGSGLKDVLQVESTQGSKRARDVAGPDSRSRMVCISRCCPNIAFVCPFCEDISRWIISCRQHSEFPVFVDRLDRPFEFLPESLAEELLDGHVELLAEDNCESGIDVIL